MNVERSDDVVRQNNRRKYTMYDTHKITTSMDIHVVIMSFYFIESESEFYDVGVTYYHLMMWVSHIITLWCGCHILSPYDVGVIYCHLMMWVSHIIILWCGCHIYFVRTEDIVVSNRFIQRDETILSPYDVGITYHYILNAYIHM